MKNIIDQFGYEKCFEDDDNVFYRNMHGYKVGNFFGLKTISKRYDAQIFLFVMSKNKEYDNEPRIIYFDQIKDLRLKTIFFKKYRKFNGCGLKEAVKILDSGEIQTKNELEYDFLKSFFLHIGFRLKWKTIYNLNLWSYRI